MRKIGFHGRDTYDISNITPEYRGLLRLEKGMANLKVLWLTGHYLERAKLSAARWHQLLFRQAVHTSAKLCMIFNDPTSKQCHLEFQIENSGSSRPLCEWFRLSVFLESLLSVSTYHNSCMPPEVLLHSCPKSRSICCYILSISKLWLPAYTLGFYMTLKLFCTFIDSLACVGAT